MEDYGKVLLIAMPIFLLLIVVEMIATHLRGKSWDIIDSVASLCSGMTNILKDTLGLSIVVVSYPFLLAHLGTIEWSAGSVLPYVVTFVVLDFFGYWRHRSEHEINVLWNLHVVHHSSETFNLPCALRQSISRFTNILIMLMYGVPLALLGIPHEVFLVIAPIHLFAQFWYHTELIGSMSFLEHFLVTPSHHRVHHAMNDVYLDKNYSEVFIVWDKLFGTFQPELAGVPPVYGVRRAVQTWNPFAINFQHLALLISDAWHTKNLSDKMRIWFMPTGWRPDDVSETRPIDYIRDTAEFQKYTPHYSSAFKVWAVVQLVCNFLLLAFLFYSFGKITYTEALLYGIFLLYTVFSFTLWLDKNIYFWYADALRLIIGVAWIYVYGDWFGIKSSFEAAHWGVAAYFALSFGLNAYFLWKEQSTGKA